MCSRSHFEFQGCAHLASEGYLSSWTAHEQIPAYKRTRGRPARISPRAAHAVFSVFLSTNRNMAISAVNLKNTFENVLDFEMTAILWKCFVRGTARTAQARTLQRSGMSLWEFRRKLLLSFAVCRISRKKGYPASLTLGVGSLDMGWVSAHTFVYQVRSYSWKCFFIGKRTCWHHFLLRKAGFNKRMVGIAISWGRTREILMILILKLKYKVGK